ncbi:hypothetical protein [Halarchaeum nitratireducens]|uniref:Uncharacterized protein n=1 Tax=Halarchaeum nitratireducens TaxID=489913 RepID=A0A830GDF3_9EURY|nr:hypothetical protein [Halarchaeum nitratireducens]GGN23575.1 hypothetical protein GCM10009021_26460 [Halarchaeum nitratireducens]
MFAFDGGYDPGEASHTALLELRRTVERHPAVRHATGEPPGQFIHVAATLDPTVLGSDADAGTLTIRWYAGETADAEPAFAFHYSDATGFDCGWHHEPNPHVEERAHSQERPIADDDYEYDAVEFGSLQPVPLLWAILDRLEARLTDR